MDLKSRFSKDQAKAKVCTHFIGLGSVGSSTHSYMQQYGENANQAVYDPLTWDTPANKRVFVSLNGQRPNRIPFKAIEDLIDHAVAHGMTIVCDNSYHRNRSYNVGERELAFYMDQFVIQGAYTYQDHVSYGVYTATF